MRNLKGLFINGSHLLKTCLKTLSYFVIKGDALLVTTIVLVAIVYVCERECPRVFPAFLPALELQW